MNTLSHNTKNLLIDILDREIELINRNSFLDEFQKIEARTQVECAMQELGILSVIK